VTQAHAPELGNLSDDILDRLPGHAGDVALARMVDGEWQDVTLGDFHHDVLAVAKGLVGAGVSSGDRVALLSKTRYEWTVADYAIWWVGAATVPVYETSSTAQIAWILSDSGAVAAIVESDAHLTRVKEAMAEAPDLRDVWVLDDGAIEQITERGAGVSDADVEARRSALSSDTLATLIYTSGTTGPPKGVQLEHRNLIAATKLTESLIRFPDGAKVISWLPAAHIAERMAHHYLPVVFAMTITTCDNPREIVGYLPAVRPTWFFAVPRIWEKLKAGMESFLLQGENAARNQAWLAGAARKVELEQAGEEVPPDLARTVEEADRELFAGLRSMLGLDEAISVNVGAAPTPREVLVFFHAIGIPLAELWGMSETCGAGACNPPGRVKIGTVGPPGPGVEVRLAGDGELLIRSDVVMPGYRNAPGQTAEALDADGWLHTGDIAEIDDDGYIRIVDRKKEIIINAAGKNMSPANIESTLKGASPLIGQVCVIGDGRRYNTALIVLDSDFAPAWAAQNGIAETDLASLARDERMRAAVQAGVDAANAQLARVEQIKTFSLVEGDWLPGGDEITPTMKLKRKPIAGKYAAQIEQMYAAS
jgi:long-subunit acyl-CoA synthetase (AMP-forming)